MKKYHSAPSGAFSAEGGFTLVELLVVIGIIAILIALLLPSLNKAQSQAMKVQCMSNERQIGMAMLSYATEWKGYLFPPGLGWPGAPSGSPPGTPPPNPNFVNGDPQHNFDVWPYYVFNRIWNPPVMVCPADHSPDPDGQHSYLANDDLLSNIDKTTGLPKNGAATRPYDIRYGVPLPNRRNPALTIVLGEKITLSIYDYYMDSDDGDFQKKVEQHRHGPTVGSNYLMLDMHVTTDLPAEIQNALDPWDPLADDSAVNQ